MSYDRHIVFAGALLLTATLLFGVPPSHSHRRRDGERQTAGTDSGGDGLTFCFL
jgi:hypothetical protein